MNSIKDKKDTAFKLVLEPNTTEFNEAEPIFSSSPERVKITNCRELSLLPDHNIDYYIIIGSRSEAIRKLADHTITSDVGPRSCS